MAEKEGKAMFHQGNASAHTSSRAPKLSSKIYDFGLSSIVSVFIVGYKKIYVSGLRQRNLFSNFQRDNALALSDFTAHLGDQPPTDSTDSTMAYLISSASDNNNNCRWRWRWLRSKAMSAVEGYRKGNKISTK